MEMNAFERSEVVREMDHVEEERRGPSVDPVRQEFCYDEQPTAGPPVPDEGPTDTFIGGAGI
jgi:hypothetical protein